MITSKKINLFFLGNAKKSKADSDSLHTADVVAITAVVCGLCSFTAGLLVGGVLTQCCRKCWIQQRRGKTEKPPVYEDVEPNKNIAIELQYNDAYGHIQT